MQQFRDWAIEAPIFLTDDGLGMIEVSQLLSVLEEYKDVSGASGVFSVRHMPCIVFIFSYSRVDVGLFARESWHVCCGARGRRMCLNEGGRTSPSGFRTTWSGMSLIWGIARGMNAPQYG